MQLHIGYMRSIEDSERTRAACLRYLQASLIYFYPDKLDIVGQAKQMARDLGGQLVPPHLSWKYSWMRTVFGWRAAKSDQRVLLKSRWSVERRWDKVRSNWKTDNKGRSHQARDGPQNRKSNALVSSLELGAGCATS